VSVNKGLSLQNVDSAAYEAVLGLEGYFRAGHIEPDLTGLVRIRAVDRLDLMHHVADWSTLPMGRLPEGGHPCASHGPRTEELTRMRAAIFRVPGSSRSARAGPGHRSALGPGRAPCACVRVWPVVLPWREPARHRVDWPRVHRCRRGDRRRRRRGVTGDMVVAHFIHSDKSCPHCRNGSTISCVQGGNLGNGDIDGVQGPDVAERGIPCRGRRSASTSS
jgi:hypothetical protein